MIGHKVILHGDRAGGLEGIYNSSQYLKAYYIRMEYGHIRISQINNINIEWAIENIDNITKDSQELKDCWAWG